MTARYLNIEAKERQDGALLASLNDFTVSDGEIVEIGQVLSKPNVSLYCFADDTKRAIFVELPVEVNLATVPFIFQTQYDMAQRLIAVPYTSFREFAHSLPTVEHLIMIYSSARSGTTLLSHIFNELDRVMSLSEPDVISQFLHLRGNDHSRDSELRELFDCTVRMLFKPNPYKIPKTYAIKGRMEMVRVMDIFTATIPHAKNLYLYRDAVGFVRSFYRVLKQMPLPHEITLAQAIAQFNRLYHYDLTPNTACLDPDSEMISFIQYLTFQWVAGIEWYMEQARNIPTLAVRYADLNENREKTLEAIFAYCDLPVEQVARTLVAYERDSQAGTFMARENPKEGNKLQLTETQLAEMNRILARHPIIQQSDFIAPNTLRI